MYFSVGPVRSYEKLYLQSPEIWQAYSCEDVQEHLRKNRLQYAQFSETRQFFDLQSIEDLTIEAKCKPFSKDDLLHSGVNIAFGDLRNPTLNDIVFVELLFFVHKHKLRLLQAHQLEIKEIFAELLAVDIDEGSTVATNLIQYHRGDENMVLLSDDNLLYAWKYARGANYYKKG